MITDFKVRYQNSVLGYLWSLLRPMALFLIMYVVFVRFLKVGATIPNYPVYLLIGIVIWNFFVEITTGNVSSIVSRGDIIRKINFPKYTLIIAGSISALINLIINLFVVSIFVVLRGMHIGLSVSAFPLLVLELYIFGLGLAFILSAMYVRFRDIGYIWEVVMQGAFYATPILYPLDKPVPLLAQKILLLNPVAQIIQDSRLLVVTDSARTFSTIFHSNIFRIIPVGVSVLFLVLGALYFRRSSRSFAENV